jgi:hypothetical protein
MNSYIEKMLHIKTAIAEYKEMDKLPLYLKGLYRLYILNIAGNDYLLAEPKEVINLSALRKQREQLKKISKMECVMYFESVKTYTKQKLIEEGIPFIIKEKQIYIPFLGMVLDNQNERILPEVKKISYLTQKMLLVAIYQRWEKISLTDVARAICVSKMSITRCFDELEALEMPLISKLERSRYFVWEQGNIALWNMIQSILRNPVAKEYRLDKHFNVKELPLGGMTALSWYTIINDNAYRTYAITKDLAKCLQISVIPCVPKGEVPAEVIQVVQYDIPFGDGTAIDPLSAILSLSEEKKRDPRVEAAINEIVERKLND